MAEKLPKKETPKAEESDLMETEKLPEDSKNKESTQLFRSTLGSVDSASGIDERFESNEDASSSAESRSSGSANAAATSKVPRLVAHKNKTPDSFTSVRLRSSKSCSPQSRRKTLSALGSSGSTSGVDVTYGSPEGASSSAESRSGESATGAQVAKTTPNANRSKDSTAVEESPRASGTTPRRKRSHSLSSIGTRIKSVAVAFKSSIALPHFKRIASSDAASGSSAGDSIPLMQEENESSDSVEEPAVGEMILSDNKEEKMEISPTPEVSDIDDSMQGASGEHSEKTNTSQHPEEVIETQLSTESSNESSNFSDEKRKLLMTPTRAEMWKNITWSLESTKSSLPGTATTSVNSLESLSADNSADVDSYDEAQVQAQGRRRQRDGDSEEEAAEDHGGPTKRPALERRDKDDDEDPPAQKLPLPNPERLI